MTREKAKRAAYTLEYKREAVRLVTGGQAKSVTVKVLGIPAPIITSSITVIGWSRICTVGQPSSRFGSCHGIPS